MNKDQRLDEIIAGHLPGLRSGQETVVTILYKHPHEANALRPKLEAALWLINAGKYLSARPGFITSSRSYLVQRIQSIPPRSIWQRLIGRYSPQRWVFNLAASGLLIAVIVLMLNSLVLSARLSIPGDPLYSTKLSIEKIQVAFTLDPKDQTDLYLQFSRERTSEFVELVLDGDYAQLPAAADRTETDIIAALHSLNEVSVQQPASELPMVTNFRDTLSSEIYLLRLLKETSPSSAQPGIDLAIQVSQSAIMALR